MHYWRPIRTGYSSRPDTRALPPSTYAARAPALAAASDADDRAPVPQGAPAGTQPHVLWSWVLLLGVPLAWALYGLRRGLLGASPTPVSLHAVAVNAETEEEFDARKFRRSLNKTGRYSRKLQKLPESVEQMEEDGVGYSRTGLVAQMRTGDFKFAVVCFGVGAWGTGARGQGSGGRRTCRGDGATSLWNPPPPLLLLAPHRGGRDERWWGRHC